MNAVLFLQGEELITSRDEVTANRDAYKAVKRRRQDAMNAVLFLQGEFDQVTNVAHANLGAGC